MFTIEQLKDAATHYYDIGQVGDTARELLTKFSDDPNTYGFSIEIIPNNSYPGILRIISSQTLNKLINQRWKSISEGERDSISQFLMSAVHNYSQEENKLNPLMTELNLAFVSLLIQEWPERFPNIIQELVEAGQTSVLLCKNTLDIILLLCEQSLENYEDRLTYARSNQLAASLREHTAIVYNFVELVMTSSGEKELVLVCLKILRFFIKWVSPQQILETKLFQALCNMFLPKKEYVTEVLDLFDEIFSLNDLPEVYSSIIPEVFSLMMNSLIPLLPDDVNFQQLLVENERFIRVLPSTLTVFLDKFGTLIEVPSNVNAIQTTLQWFCKLSYVDDFDTLKTCCEFWLAIARRSHKERNNNVPSAISAIYSPFLPIVRRMLITRMERPDEILIVYNEDTGSYEREQQRNTLTLMLHATMKECLVLLTHIDQIDTINAINERLNLLGQQWNPDVCNSICWSVGAITRTFSLENERKFVSSILQVLLQMCSRMPDPNNRAIIASGIMYVCSQYPRFLTKFPQFLQTVVDKLFEFMHQNVDGVKEMAVNSFKTIANACKKQFLSNQSIIYNIFHNYREITSDLPPTLQLVFIDAVSIVIQSNFKEQQKLEQLDEFLIPFNERWDACMENFNPQNIPLAREISFLLHVNATIACNIGKTFQKQMSTLFPQIMNMYQQYSKILPQLIEMRLVEDIKVIKSCKGGVLLVIKNFIWKTQNINLVVDPLIDDIMNIVVSDYANSPNEAKVYEVLQLLTTLFTKAADKIRSKVPIIFDAVFQQTVVMISADYDQNVQFRLPFYEFLSILVKQSISIFINAPAEVFTTLVQTICWGATHPTHEVCILSIKTMMDLFKEMKTTNVFDEFISQYYIMVINQLFLIMTDTIHKFAFDEQVDLLIVLLTVQNSNFTPQTIAECVYEIFNNRDPNEILSFIEALLGASNDKLLFRRIMRDFLVTTRQFNATDPDLYRAESQAENEQNQKEFNETLDNEGMEDLLN